MTDHVYVNLSINNDSPTESSILAEFDTTYTTPIIKNPEDYYMAVVKFAIPLDTLPILDWPEDIYIGVCPNQNYGNVVPPPDPAPAMLPGFLEPITYIPNTNVLAESDVRYRYVYTYQRIAELISFALNDSFKAAGSPGSAAPPATQYPPYLRYDVNTSQFEFILPKVFQNDASGASNGWTICWNGAFNRLFPNFNTYLKTGTEGIRFELNLYDVESKLVGDNYVVKQDFNGLDYLNSISKILIQSSSLPVAGEMYPPPNNSTSSTKSSQPIISEFDIDLNNQAGLQRSIVYYSADIYRLIDINSTVPINRISLKISWSDRFNVIRPLFVSESISVKLAFFKKGLSYN